MAETSETTPEKLKSGVKIDTAALTKLRVNSPTVEILIGGPYRGRDGELHSYGHAALRVITSSRERIYDFGRYGKVTGDFGAEGEGILRVWDSFAAYIAGENAYGRATKGFAYSVSSSDAEKVVSYFDQMVGQAIHRRSKHPNQQEYKLPKNYHALTHNCATLTLGGARIALPDLDVTAPQHNEGRGMSTVEKMAARAKNFGRWPEKIFMPADVGEMLEAERRYPRVTKDYGATKR